jgi:hypothetical protein
MKNIKKVQVEHARPLGYKRPNLWIMGIEGEEVKAKGIANIFFKNYSRKFPQSWEREGYLGTGDFHDTKEIRSKKNFPKIHYN